MQIKKKNWDKRKIFSNNKPETETWTHESCEEDILAFVKFTVI